MKFMGLTEDYCGEDSYFYLLPVEYEKDVTYGDGASKGSTKILKASKHLEWYEEQFDNEPFVKGINTLEPLNLMGEKPERVKEIISDEVKKYKDKFLITLGGDHSVTIGVVNGLLDKEDFSVLILDAHSDMRHSWNNSKYNHACVSKRISEKTSVGIIGVRSQDIDEAKEINESEKVNQLKAYDINDKRIKELLRQLKDKVYISIDVDVFDPSFIRNTGTAEPGGFSWNQVIDILKTVFVNKDVIAADIVEFAPKENFDAEAFSLARLAYKLMALKLLDD